MALHGTAIAQKMKYRYVVISVLILSFKSQVQICIQIHCKSLHSPENTSTKFEIPDSICSRMNCMALQSITAKPAQKHFAFITLYVSAEDFTDNALTGLLFRNKLYPVTVCCTDYRVSLPSHSIGCISILMILVFSAYAVILYSKCCLH